MTVLVNELTDLVKRGVEDFIDGGITSLEWRHSGKVFPQETNRGRVILKGRVGVKEGK